MTIRNIVVISDTHFGCKLALCPPKIRLEEGGFYKQSKLQKIIYKQWQYFWAEFVPEATKNEPFIIVHNGDVIDGVHHNTTTLITNNLKDQEHIAVECLEPIVNQKLCKGIYFVRGTPAHSGLTAEHEERIAEKLKAFKTKDGNYSRYELWLEFGRNRILAHFAHHVGVTNSASYESTAPYKELIEMYVEAGKQGARAPDVIIRSHRHRFFVNQIGSKNVNAFSVITPGWQMKTPFSYRGILGRASLAQIGGVVLKEGDEVPIYIRHSILQIKQNGIERV